MSIERSVTDRERLGTSRNDGGSTLDDWVADLRRVMLDNLQRTAAEGRRATLRDRLFPLGSDAALSFRDVLYSESAWAAGTLVICFVSYLLPTGNPIGALASTLVASLIMLPLLVVWAGLGYYYVRKRR